MCNLPRLLSIEGVCQYLQMGKTTVYELIRSGDIPHMRVRSRIRVSADDLKEYLENNKQRGMSV